ncbi:MAG: prepilin-type N-terminal cleavage/methylation domain-containing protein [Nitrospirae bacterium]|uniref:type IV pilus modification PilV family protein n=1 Tax=Candidatus Magnetobacterium casense TaxID=1455061 RepID=UPI0006970ABB|nr:prepilin-type N-terminal cleavage/methylation domain-containing protein [Candidatus Magnetobacterium casensis]MBF0339263.1 prepilin-type N-terminal cleavage/methylation domain-containing protein [Nitrospirota bacterium]
MSVNYDNINNCADSIQGNTAPYKSVFNDKGFTLVEALVSMVILLFVMVALLQTVTVASNVTYKNELRDEVTKIVKEELEATRDANFDGVLTGTCEKCTSPNTYTRQFKNASINFGIVKTVTVLDANNKRVDITVTWVFKGETMNYTVNTLISR